MISPYKTLMPGVSRSNNGALGLALSVGQQPADLFHVAGLDELHLPQAAFTLGGFLGQNMAVMGLAKDIFAAAGLAKTFGS
jgi:hypothetical protein